MDLTPIQISILEGKVCPYCKCIPEFVDSAVIYNGRSYDMIYLCRPCDAYVGVHKTDGVTPLGRLANAELRGWKKKAHEAFDEIWQDKYMTRDAAYDWLSDELGTPREYTHIGMFSVKTCQQVIEKVKQFFISQY